MLKIKNTLANGKWENKKHWIYYFMKIIYVAIWACRMFRSWAHNIFKMIERIRKFSKEMILGPVQVEVERAWTASWHTWTADSTAEKEGLSLIISWSVMKSGYNTIILSINFGVKVEYPWFEASPLHLVGSTRCIFLMRILNRLNQWDDRYWIKLMFESSNEVKSAAIRVVTGQSVFATSLLYATCCITGENLHVIA